MINFRHVDISELISCHQLGMQIASPDVREGKLPEDTLRSELMQFLQTNVNPVQAQLTLQALAASVHAMNAMHRHEFEQAEHLLRSGRSSFQLHLRHEIGYQLADSSLAAAEAYLHYRRGTYEQALASLKQAHSATLDLYDHDMQIPILESRRLQLETNRARVQSCMKAYDEAAIQALDNLLYLAGDASQGPFCFERNQAILDNFAVKHRLGYAYPLVQELATIFVMMPLPPKPAQTKTIEQYIKRLSATSDATLFTAPIRWLRLKLLSWHQHASYLSEAVEYLSNGDQGWPILWLSIEKDICDVDSSGEPNGLQILHEYIAGTRKRDVPAAFVLDSRLH